MRVDSRSVLIALVILIVLAGAAATLLALRSRRGRSEVPAPGSGEPAIGWRVRTPSGWTTTAADSESVRFMLDGLLVGGLEITQAELVSVLPDHARIEATWVAMTRWGQAVAYEVTAPLVEPDEAETLVRQLTGAGMGIEADDGGRRPETHCVLTQGSRIVHLWTRENAGFPPQAAASAAVTLLASLEPIAKPGEEVPGSVPAGIDEPSVRLVRVAPASPTAAVSSAFDVQIVVTNGSDAAAQAIPASLGVEGREGSGAHPLPARTEIIDDLQPGQSVILVAPSVRLPEGAAPATAYRVYAGVAPTGRGLELTITAAQNADGR